MSPTDCVEYDRPAMAEPLLTSPKPVDTGESSGSWFEVAAAPSETRAQPGSIVTTPRFKLIARKQVSGTATPEQRPAVVPDVFKSPPHSPETKTRGVVGSAGTGTPEKAGAVEGKADDDKSVGASINALFQDSPVLPRKIQRPLQ